MIIPTARPKTTTSIPTTTTTRTEPRGSPVNIIYVYEVIKINSPASCVSRLVKYVYIYLRRISTKRLALHTACVDRALR